MPINEKQLDVVEAYLCEGWSYRKIQEVILKIHSPESGGGFEAMSILHSFGIADDHKNILHGRGFNRDIFRKEMSLKRYLESINEEMVESTTCKIESRLIKAIDKPLCIEDPRVSRLIMSADSILCFAKFHEIINDGQDIGYRITVSSDAAGDLSVCCVFGNDYVFITCEVYNNETLNAAFDVLKCINDINDLKSTKFVLVDGSIVASSRIVFEDHEKFCKKTVSNHIKRLIEDIDGVYGRIHALM